VPGTEVGELGLEADEFGEFGVADVEARSRASLKVDVIFVHETVMRLTLLMPVWVSLS
jgi:hypothetical protein